MLTGIPGASSQLFLDTYYAPPQESRWNNECEKIKARKFKNGITKDLLNCLARGGKNFGLCGLPETMAVDIAYKQNPEIDRTDNGQHA